MKPVWYQISSHDRMIAPDNQKRMSGRMNPRKVITLEVSFEADVEADEPIRARLDTLLGKGTQDLDTGEWQWKGKIPVRYSYTDAHVFMVIGQP